MAVLPSRSNLPTMDRFSRILIIIASFFSIAALTLTIVGIATPSWYYGPVTNGNVIYFNLFTYCTSNVTTGSSVCIDMQRQTDLGIATQYAGAFLVVAICLLGCGMCVILAMNVLQLTGILLFVAPILLFLAALFMVAAFAEGSRVMFYNSYSAILVQSGHVATIFSMGIIAFASGRLHIRYYGQF